MYSPKLKIWFDEAIKENKRNPVGLLWLIIDYLLPGFKGRYIKFPDSFIDRIISIESEKCLDYSFVGAIGFTDTIMSENRRWVIEYAKLHFNDACVFHVTDVRDTSQWESLGTYDISNETPGFVPKTVPIVERNYFDKRYYTTLLQSKFVLCPAGDANWSIRFYEAILCKAIPILELKKHGQRTSFEARLDFEFYKVDDVHIYDEDIVERNYKKLLKISSIFYFGKYLDLNIFHRYEIIRN